MAIARFARQAKRPHGVCIKTMAVAILGLCFIFFWSMFSSPSSSITVQRDSFDELAEPVSATARERNSETQLNSRKNQQKEDDSGKQGKKVEALSSSKEKESKKVNPTTSLSSGGHKSRNQRQKHASTKKKGKDKPKSSNGGTSKEKEVNLQERVEAEESEKDTEDLEEVQEVVDGKEEEEVVDGEGETNGETEGEDGADPVELVDQETQENVEEKDEGSKKKRKMKGPVFDPKAHYSWRSCNTRSKHNYIPCIDIESLIGRFKGYRHHERSCPRTPPMCLVPLPGDGYDSPVRWPESKLKILYKNVAHPKLAEYVKKHSWLEISGEYLTFPPNQTEYKGGVAHYLESIEEMVPDIEWGKNIRLVLDIGCGDSSFAASLLDKQVLTLSLGLKDDLVDLAQVSLERGFPTIVSPFSSRRLPVPSGVFDAIHCSECSIPWHSSGKLLLEMNRILRPGGYFILSSKHDSIEEEEAMTKMTASICWNVLAHKTDETAEVAVKIYQKPQSNDIYELRWKKSPPLCKESENPDAAWYIPMKTCLHSIPSAIEQHGTEWPEEWPKRLETYPEWLNDKEKAIAELKHWKAVVQKSYLTGMGIDWSTIRNVMDMKAIYGGFAAALAEKKIWVMNVVPVHAPDTLPFIYERGFVGVYHDWCESFGTYPRSYDLLHADHLFSRLKNRCKQPVSIVVEIDRVLRPGGWVIVRDKEEILVSLEGILKSLHWEIRMTFYQDGEGILVAQKTTWRP